MRYLSTRGQFGSASFSEAVLSGLSRDGGLFVPENLPDFSTRLDTLKCLNYQELAFELMFPFTSGEFTEEKFKKIISKSYSKFEHQEITPLKFLKDKTILELFHGPTLAFKDIGLQFLGNIFEELLSKTEREMNIIGATSGDTGSAAIQGVRGKKGIRIFMLHPARRVSPIQEKQMTTVLEKNVHNIAIKGSFDDAQRIVKEMFNDLQFRDKHKLGAVNSINWARIMAQIVYYFYAAFQFEKVHPGKPLFFSVPTGNFGNIFAGYLASQMGLPIRKLILATNENNILSRMIASGTYRVSKVVPTLSPSMDIQISSNFERLLFDLLNRDSEQLVAKMDSLTKTGSFDISNAQLSKLQKIFSGVTINTEQTLECIRNISKQDEIIDPHTAVGIAAAAQETGENVICLATAHPAKFGDAVNQAINLEPEIPASLKGILQNEFRCIDASADTEKIKAIMEKEIG